MALLGRRKPDNPVLVLEHGLNALLARRAELETKLVAAAAAMVALRQMRAAMLDADLDDATPSGPSQCNRPRNARDRDEVGLWTR